MDIIGLSKNVRRVETSIILNKMNMFLKLDHGQTPYKGIKAFNTPLFGNIEFEISK